MFYHFDFLNKMRGIILHTIYSARRDRFIFGLLIGMIISVLISSFLGGTALVESDQMRVIYSASACRFVIMIGLMVFISFHIRKLFENKEMDVFLSRVPSRASIIISLFTAFTIIGFVVIAQAVLVLMLIYMQNIVDILYWGLTLCLEGLVVISMSVFFSVVIRSATLGLLISFAGYLLSRVIGSFVAYIDIAGVNFSFNSIIEMVLKITSVVIPRLDLFAKSSIIIYSDYNLSSFGILLAQSLVYTAFIISCAILDMRTKEF